ncbi:trimeric LpxA-like protein [Hyaloraphidium curvatum]|nr:trimeric LpxA-like protein [Hyaloraphidium curvatum]
MPADRIVLLRCGGGHAGIVWETLVEDYAQDRDDGHAAVWDDAAEVHRSLEGFRHLRTAEEVRAFAGDRTIDCFVANGTPATRKLLVEELRRELPGPRLRFPNAVHKTAWRPPNCSFGEGNYVGPFARIGPSSSIGNFCIVNPYSLVSHDVVLEDFCQMNGHASVGGYTRLGTGCWLSLSAAVADHLTIAPWTRLGMNAAVHKSITEPGLTWVGTPARPIAKKDKEGGEESKEPRMQSAEAGEAVPVQPRI